MNMESPSQLTSDPSSMPLNELLQGYRHLLLHSAGRVHMTAGEVGTTFKDWRMDSKPASLASYPGLLTPAFVICKGRPGKTDHVQWTCGGMAHSFCTAFLNPRKHRQDPSDVEHSVLLWSVFGIGSAIGNVSWVQAFPRVSIARDKCRGEKAWVRGYSFITCYEH